MDKYKMVKLLGKGGFGEAHLVQSKVRDKSLTPSLIDMYCHL